MCVYVKRACCRPRLVCHLAAGIKNNNRKQTMPSSRHLRLSAQQAVRGGSRERVSRREGKRGREEEESGSGRRQCLFTYKLLEYFAPAVIRKRKCFTAHTYSHARSTHPSHTPLTHTHMHTLLYRHTLALRRQLSSSIIKSELFTLYGIISACVRQCMCERECVCVSECVYTCMCVNVCL